MIYILLVLIIQLFIQPVSAQNTVSEQLRLEEYACLASDPASFKACIEEARATGVPLINIIKPIVCESRDECTFEMKGLKSFLRVSPTNGQNKFIRKDDFGYTLLNVEDSSNIEFSGLVFEDESASGCPAATTCPPLFNIDNSTAIKIDKVTFSKTQSTSLKVTDSRDISILSSVFKDSFKTGLEVSAKDFTQGLKIEKNTFENNSGSGLLFQATGAGGDSLIQFNKFINNHSKGAYSNCLFPCTGAQVKITGPTNNLRFSQNTLSGGINTIFDSLGLYSSGIEIGGRNINNTTLFCNEVSGNRGSGIVQSGPFANISALTITENKIWGNGLNLNIPTATADENNCYTKECALACSQAN